MNTVARRGKSQSTEFDFISFLQKYEVISSSTRQISELTEFIKYD
jgi:hypothetical protein